MTKMFIELPAFQKAWQDMGLSDDDLFELETKLLLNPLAGKVIKGTGGARKIRFATQEKGKRGGARVIYVNVIVDEAIYLLYSYPKSIKDDLTPQERINIRKLIMVLKS